MTARTLAFDRPPHPEERGGASRLEGCSSALNWLGANWTVLRGRFAAPQDEGLGWAALLAFALAACVLPAQAHASQPQYEFLPAPQINLSLVYRLDKLTGDVIACQFAHNPGRSDVGPGAFGVTSCYRGGDGATKQEPSDYGLIATRHEQEGGVFRVDYRTGALSVCYLYFQREKQGDHEAIADQYVVCTPQWGQPAPARQSGALGQAPEAAGAPARD